ncbi:MAG: DUF3791 domain-containing protein [Eggerthellaceae bacterium]|nr:DUF3791 domain-containing protein [Eggerthellaceae bacterium]
MSAEEKSKITYITACVFEFASRFGMNPQEAMGYLSKYEGIRYLDEFYDIEHTLPFNDTMNALQTICMRNGGAVA